MVVVLTALCFAVRFDWEWFCRASNLHNLKE